MNKEVQVFNFNGLNDVRTQTIDDVVWFAAKDVCDILELSNVGQALSRLDNDEKDVIILNDVTGRQQEMLTINESGLYSLVLSSRKPEAKLFKKWVTSDVLPTIRKTGKYDVSESPYLKHRDEVMKQYAEVKYLKETNEAKDKQIAALTEYNDYMRKTPKERQRLGFNTNRLRQTPVIELDLDLNTPFKTVTEASSELNVSEYTINAALETLGLLDVLSRPTTKANCHYVIIEGMLHWNIKTIARSVLATGDIRFDLIDSVKSKFNL